MDDWAEQEVVYAELGDARRRRRLGELVTALSQHPTASVPQACGSWAGAKAAYRLWDSPHVKAEAIRAAHSRKAVERCAGHATVLAIQDTTSLDFTHHPATAGLGPLDHPGCSGLKVHSVLAVSPEGVPLGMVHQAVWARDRDRVGLRRQRREKATKEKESQRWLTALQATQEALGSTRVVSVGDREADIYDLMAAPRPPTADLLIRAAHNRRVDHEERYLWEAISKSPVQGSWDLTLHRRDNQAARTVRLTVRYERVVVLPPRHRSKEALEPVPVHLVLVEEAQPPPGIAPVRWLLLTTIPVRSLEEALRCVRYYSYRWLIERYHFVLKSGCQVESLQLEEAARLQRALATYCIVAWRLLWLTYEARKAPAQSCEAVFRREEWQSLYCFLHRSPAPPSTPPSLQDVVRSVARLGGFLGRKHDGQPGVKTIWTGLQRLGDITAMWEVLHSTLASADVGNE